MLREEASPEALGLLRIVLFACWLYVLLVVDVSLVFGFPREFFTVTGVWRVLPTGVWDTLLTPGGITGVRLVAIAFTLLALVGVRPFPLVGVPAFLSILLFDGILKGYSGYLSHTQATLVFLTLLVTFFPMADAFSVMGRRRDAPREGPTQGAALIAAAFVMTLPYTLIGYHRLFTGGLEVFTGDAFLHWLVIRSVEEIRIGPNLGLWIAGNPFLLKMSMVGFVVVTVFEILSPLAVMNRPFRHAWVVVIVGFHVTTMLTMNIFFWQNLILVPLVFTPVLHLVAPAPARREEEEGPIVFLDGECVLCHGFARRLMRMDKRGVLRFGILQGETAARRGVAPAPGDAGQWSVVLWRGEGDVSRHSDAALGALAALGGLHGLWGVLLWVPRPVRDAVYRTVARNRYQWFGKRDVCGLPQADERRRLVP